MTRLFDLFLPLIPLRALCGYSSWFPTEVRTKLELLRIVVLHVVFHVGRKAFPIELSAVTKRLDDGRKNLAISARGFRARK